MDPCDASDVVNNQFYKSDETMWDGFFEQGPDPLHTSSAPWAITMPTTLMLNNLENLVKKNLASDDTVSDANTSSTWTFKGREGARIDIEVRGKKLVDPGFLKARKVSFVASIWVDLAPGAAMNAITLRITTGGGLKSYELPSEWKWLAYGVGKLIPVMLNDFLGKKILKEIAKPYINDINNGSMSSGSISGCVNSLDGQAVPSADGESYVCEKRMTIPDFGRTTYKSIERNYYSPFLAINFSDSQNDSFTPLFGTPFQLSIEAKEVKSWHYLDSMKTALSTAVDPVEYTVVGSCGSSELGYTGSLSASGLGIVCSQQKLGDPLDVYSATPNGQHRMPIRYQLGFFENLSPTIYESDARFSEFFNATYPMNLNTFSTAGVVRDTMESPPDARDPDVAKEALQEQWFYDFMYCAAENPQSPFPGFFWPDWAVDPFPWQIVRDWVVHVVNPPQFDVELVEVFLENVFPGIMDTGVINAEEIAVQPNSEMQWQVLSEQVSYAFTQSPTSWLSTQRIEGVNVSK